MTFHCMETLELAYLFIDGELEDGTRVEIEAHLERCRPCYERYGLEREVTLLLGRLRHHQTCPEGLRRRICALLDED